MSDRPFKGRVAVVTGAGSGIGEATARRFAGLGAQVVLVDIDRAAAERVAASLEGALPLNCDVADLASVETMIDAAVARFGPIDILFNNASPISWQRHPTSPSLTGGG